MQGQLIMYLSSCGLKLFEVECILLVTFWILITEESSKIRGTEHMHAPIYVIDSSKNEDSEIGGFIDKCITCALPDETKYVEIRNLVKKVKSRKKDVASRFNATWVPSDESRIVHCEENMNETKIKQSKKLFDKVNSYIVTMNDLSHITLSEILEKTWIYRGAI